MAWECHFWAGSFEEEKGSIFSGPENQKKEDMVGEIEMKKR